MSYDLATSTVPRGTMDPSNCATQVAIVFFIFLLVKEMVLCVCTVPDAVLAVALEVYK